MPGSFSDLARRMGPTVVNIRVTKAERTAGPGMPGMPDGPWGDLFRRFFREAPPFPDRFRLQGAGSGVIISPDGLILTNNHVVEGAKQLTVTLADQREYSARVIGGDPKTDLAVVKVEAKETLRAAALGDSDALSVGDWVVAVGNPFGLSHTVTAGIVSAKGRVIGAGPYDDFIQTDASINPGNSGGPLFNMAGEVVGINTAVMPQGQGIGFAIPANVAKPLIPQLQSRGRVTRGYLGVSVQSISPELGRALGLHGRKGALVADVAAHSPAQEAGIRRGDVITGLDDQPIEDARALSARVAQAPVGRDVEVSLLRDGVETRVSARVGELQSGQEGLQASAGPTRDRWGLGLETVTPQVARERGLAQEHGALVVDVAEGSPAERAGLREGDLILEVNRHPVKSAADARAALGEAQEGRFLAVLVKRERASLYVVLTG
jgi:serine protease Do